MNKNYMKYNTRFPVRQVQVVVPLVNEKNKEVNSYLSHACLDMTCTVYTIPSKIEEEKFYKKYKIGKTFNCLYDPLYFSTLRLSSHPSLGSSKLSIGNKMQEEDEQQYIDDDDGFHDYYYEYTSVSNDKEELKLNYAHKTIDPINSKRPSGYEFGYSWVVFTPTMYHKYMWAFAIFMFVFNISSMIYLLQKASKGMYLLLYRQAKVQ